jgi:hypothetical protein
MTSAPAVTPPDVARAGAVDTVRDTKEAALRRADAWARREVRGLSLRGPRVYVHPIGQDLRRHERERTLDDPSVRPDEHLTYAVVRELMTGPLRVRRLADADLVFVPVHAAVYEADGPFELGDIVSCLGTLGSGRPHVVCSVGDYHPRRPGLHANPFSVPGDPANPWCAKYGGEYAWLDERFIWLSPESTLDLHPADVGIPIVIPKAPVRPDAGSRPWLFSYAGRTTYQRVPEGHIRGPEASCAWARLAALSPHERSFVGSEEELRDRLGPRWTARRLPERSVFTLCPAGWGRWTFRLFEAILGGSIPVILSDYYVRPFSERIPWDLFSITVPEAHLGRVDSVLEGLSEARVRAMQAHLARNQRHFTAEGMARLLAERLADDVEGRRMS